MKLIKKFGNRHENLESLRKQFKLGNEHPIINVWQHHSVDVVDASLESTKHQYLNNKIPRDPAPPKADALFLFKEKAPKSGASLVVQTADCVPLLLEFLDPNEKSLAIAAIHCGWRGTVNGIIFETLKKMEKELSNSKWRAQACIGPNIETSCYEIGKEVANLFSDKGYESQIHPGKSENKFFLNVAGVVREQLKSLQIELSSTSSICTACNLEDYSSYRKEGSKRGRNWSLIGYRPKSH